MPSILNSDDGVVSGTSGLKSTGGNDGLLNIQTNGSNAISISSGQRSTFPTTIGVGGATPSTSGSGISFPATQSASSDANTLDDYEEGTFTPTVQGSSTAGTGTYTRQVGRYTKIGNLVTVSVNMVWTAHTGSGNLQFSNLPFSAVNTTNYASGASIGLANNIALSANNLLTAYAFQNQTFLYVEQYPVGGGASSAVPLDTSASILFTVTYEVS